MNQEETIKISKKLHDALKEEKKVSRIPMKYLLEKAFELYKKTTTGGKSNGC